MGCGNSKDGQEPKKNDKQSDSKPAKKGFLEEKMQKVKDEYNKTQYPKWKAEVIASNNLFKEVKEWFELYEPKKQKKDKKDEKKKDGLPFDPEALKKKMNEKIKASINEAAMNNILEALAKGLQFVADATEKVEPVFFSVINSLMAIILTFRFQGKDKTKFELIREYAADKFAFNFINLIDVEANKLGKGGDNIDPSVINKIIDSQVQNIYEKINEKKHLLFQGIDQYSNEIEEVGIAKEEVEDLKKIINAIQSFGEIKFEQLLQILKHQLPVLLTIVTDKYKQIKSQIAEQAQKAGFQEPSPEYIQQTRTKVLEKTSEQHKLLEDRISLFVNSFMSLINNMAEEEEAEEQKK